MRKTLILLSILMAAIFLVACDEGEEPSDDSTDEEVEDTEEDTDEITEEGVVEVGEEETAEETVAEEEDVEEVAEADPAGKALVEDRCQACHGLDQVYDPAHTAGEWNDIIDTDVHSASLDDEERALVIDFLAK